jgi:hypothetical protein
MIAQALGEYGTMATLVDGVRSIGYYLGEFGREWGLTGALVFVGAALVWKVITRVK